MAINAEAAFWVCLHASLPGMAGTTVGNYTLGRPLVAGLVVGVILGDVRLALLLVQQSSWSTLHSHNTWRNCFR